MATFVLLHGAWHGGWCWELVEPLLAARGHRVLAPNLPGVGEDRTPLAEDVLDQWTRAVAALVEAQPDPVVLVGHSRSGLLASTVSERVPERVKLAVYLAAVLLADGEAAIEAKPGSDELNAAFVPSADGSAVGIDPACVRHLFYGEVAPDLAAWAETRLGVEPLQPHLVKLRLSADRFGRVPRAYIETTRDRAIPLAKQREMQARWPCEHVVSLPSDHSPFLSLPERLADVLDDLARRVRPSSSERST